MSAIQDLEILEQLYGAPSPASCAKELDYLHPHYRAYIAASPFCIIATCGPGALDASPRGDAAGFVIVEDEKTLLIPDRRGNNRVDSLRNIIADARVALLFLIPGCAETLKVKGRATISTASELLARFSVNARLPRSVLVVHVEAVYFQCARAILRSNLWDPSRHVPRDTLPSAGTILRDLGVPEREAMNRDLASRLKDTLY